MSLTSVYRMKHFLMQTKLGVLSEAFLMQTKLGVSYETFFDANKTIKSASLPCCFTRHALARSFVQGITVPVWDSDLRQSGILHGPVPPCTLQTGLKIETLLKQYIRKPPNAWHRAAFDGKDQQKGHQQLRSHLQLTDVNARALQCVADRLCCQA